jgi:hypothetical protein
MENFITFSLKTGKKIELLPDEYGELLKLIKAVSPEKFQRHCHFPSYYPPYYYPPYYYPPYTIQYLNCQDSIGTAPSGSIDLYNTTDKDYRKG